MYPESNGRPASTPFSGTYVVVNATGGNITTVAVKHTCGDQVDPVTANILAPGATITSPLNSQTGSADHWSLVFTDSSNTTHSCGDKRCNYETDDAPLSVAVLLYLEDFSIILPVTSSCEHNSYD